MEITFHSNPWVIIIPILWVLPWKLYAVWLAARRGDKKWFVALIILNTLAVLDIIYIFYVAKKTWHEIYTAFKRVVTGIFGK